MIRTGGRKTAVWRSLLGRSEGSFRTEMLMIFYGIVAGSLWAFMLWTTPAFLWAATGCVGWGCPGEPSYVGMGCAGKNSQSSQPGQSSPQGSSTAGGAQQQVVPGQSSPQAVPGVSGTQQQVPAGQQSALSTPAGATSYQPSTQQPVNLPLKDPLWVLQSASGCSRS